MNKWNSRSKAPTSNDCKWLQTLHTSGNRHLLAPCCAAGVQGGNHGIHPIPIHRADRVTTRTSRITTGREQFEIRWETQETSIKLFWLVVYLPLWKWWTSSVGMMTFPTEWKVIKFHGSSHHQPVLTSIGDSDFFFGLDQVVSWGNHEWNLVCDSLRVVVSTQSRHEDIRPTWYMKHYSERVSEAFKTRVIRKYYKGQVHPILGRKDKYLRIFRILHWLF